MINARSYTKLSNHECIEADYGDRVSSFQSASTYFSSGLEREREREKIKVLNQFDAKNEPMNIFRHKLYVFVSFLDYLFL